MECSDEEFDQTQKGKNQAQNPKGGRKKKQKETTNLYANQDEVKQVDPFAAGDSDSDDDPIFGKKKKKNQNKKPQGKRGGKQKKDEDDEPPPLEESKEEAPK